MVLRLEQYPPEYAGFKADADNGPRNLDAEVGQAFDEDQARARLQQFEFVSGYDASYSATQASAKDSGAIVLDSGIELFKTGDGARGDFPEAQSEATSYTGKTKGNVTVNQVEQFDLKVADQAKGARYDITVKRDDGTDVNLKIIEADFRRGRLEGNVSATMAGLSDIQRSAVESRVKDLARVLNEQIAAVLAGVTPAGSASATGGS